MTETEEVPERQFGWWDMFVHPDQDPRSEGGFKGERDTLVGHLTNQRLTLQLKCADLDAEQLARRSVPPSDLSLLGLLRHLTEVERIWFRKVMAGQDLGGLYTSDDEPDKDFDGAVDDPALVQQAWDNWRAEVEFAQRFVADAPDLDVTGEDGSDLREILVHVLEEYARHNGQADLIRERIDGRVGQ